MEVLKIAHINFLLWLVPGSVIVTLLALLSNATMPLTKYLCTVILYDNDVVTIYSVAADRSMLYLPLRGQ